MEMNDFGDGSDVVVVGGVACGPKTAATLARRMPDLKITLFQKEPDLSYGSCGMPYFASGDIPSFNELINTAYGVPRDKAFFAGTKGFTAVPGAEVISIDRTAKQVTVHVFESNETITHTYDKLVIATGARPNQPVFEVPGSDRVRHFTRPDDARHFRGLAEKGQIGRAVIIGGGFIGCELAEATAGLWGIETTLIERESQILPYLLDKEMAALAEAEMKRQDVSVLTAATVESVKAGEGDNLVVKIAGQDPIETDYVFLCLGVRPETGIAADSGLEVGETGGIEVNGHLQSSDPNIYAGGDCIETTNRITGRPAFIPMGSLANRHGRVIAENIVGNETEYLGALGAFLVKVFDKNVGAVGLSEESARAIDLDVESVWGSFADHAEYYPESQSIVVKLVYRRDSMKLIGLQAVGAGDVCRRVDAFSVFLQNESSVDDLLDFEHGYAPPYSEALDPLHHLAGVAIAAQKGTKLIGPGRLAREAVSPQATWLDVRETEEVEANPWLSPNGQTINIPLGELRSRVPELDKEKPVVVICRRGPRSYQALLILEAAGFKDVCLLGGGTTAVAIGDNAAD